MDKIKGRKRKFYFYKKQVISSICHTRKRKTESTSTAAYIEKSDDKFWFIQFINLYNTI